VGAAARVITQSAQRNRKKFEAKVKTEVEIKVKREE
jgi:hypothetical protein